MIGVCFKNKDATIIGYNFDAKISYSITKDFTKSIPSVCAKLCKIEKVIDFTHFE